MWVGRRGERERGGTRGGGAGTRGRTGRGKRADGAGPRVSGQPASRVQSPLERGGCGYRGKVAWKVRGCQAWEEEKAAIRIQTGTGPVKGPLTSLAGPDLSLPPCVALCLSVSVSVSGSHSAFLWEAPSPLGRSRAAPFSPRASLTFLRVQLPWLSLSRPPRVRLCEVFLPR